MYMYPMTVYVYTHPMAIYYTHHVAVYIPMPIEITCTMSLRIPLRGLPSSKSDLRLGMLPITYGRLQKKYKCKNKIHQH